MNAPTEDHGSRLCEALERLRDVYVELDERIGRLHARYPGSTCLECGTCCTFPPGAPILYATMLEHECLASAPPPIQADLSEGECPYHEVGSNVCLARERRTISCRTHFCDDAMPEKAAREEAQDMCEWALNRVREISMEFGIEWDYGPVIDRL